MNGKMVTEKECKAKGGKLIDNVCVVNQYDNARHYLKSIEIENIISHANDEGGYVCFNYSDLDDNEIVKQQLADMGEYIHKLPQMPAKEVKIVKILDKGIHQWMKGDYDFTDKVVTSIRNISRSEAKLLEKEGIPYVVRLNNDIGEATTLFDFKTNKTYPEKPLLDEDFL